MYANQRGIVFLLLAGMVLFCGILAVDLAHGNFDYKALTVASGLVILLIATDSILKRCHCLGDPLFLPLAFMLVSIGLIMIYRLKPELFVSQAIWAGLGLIFFLVASLYFRRVQIWADYKYIWGVIGVILLLATAIFGVEIGGNKSWLIIGPLRFQPSEFAKLFIILFLTGYLNERREVLAYATRRYGPLVLPHPRFLAPLLLVWGLTMLMLVLQRDFGSSLFYFGTALIMTYIASGRKSFIGWGTGLFILGVIAAYFLVPHVKLRFDIWLDPWADPNGKSYQIIQSLFALGSGGVLGSGLTYGFPDFIPEVHTDFIFAAIGEELGFLGTGAVMLMYIILVYRAFRVALQAKASFNILLSAGVAVMLALQILVIIGGVTKFLPLTGVTMPFVSYGGSSMVTTFILLGVLFAISETRVASD